VAKIPPLWRIAMPKIEELPKEKMFAVMRGIVGTMSYLAFAYEELAEEKVGQGMFFEQSYIDMAKEFGGREARVLKRASVITTEGLDAIVEALIYSHWALYENLEITKLTEKVIRLRTLNCTTQRYVLTGREGFPCKNFGLNSRLGFVQGINPNAELRCVFCPPEPRPKDTPQEVSCQWEISLP
jgi:hypothetical protein